MAKSQDLESNGQELLEEEFIPLRTAARLTYSHIADVAQRTPTAQADPRVEHLVGIALSTVSPIYMKTTVGAGAFVLTSVELERLLFQPLRRTGTPPPLDNLLIRRRDLNKAMKTLKEARLAFGRQGSG
jgi:hypothetical protein